MTMRRIQSGGRVDDVDGNGTFKTELPHIVEPAARDELHLPNTVNFVALRETFLSTAPFIKHSNKGFWKKWIDSPQYVTVLTASLHFITKCLTENGGVNAAELTKVHGNPVIEKMSMNIAEMIMSGNGHSNSQDMLFRKLPDMLCYMIVASLQSIIPRHNRLFNSATFREIVLDWLTELIGGVRFTDCRKEREWLFADATDAKIFVHHGHGPSTHTNPQAATTAKTGLRDTTAAPTAATPAANAAAENEARKDSIAVSRFMMENSPVMAIYLNMGRSSSNPHVCNHGVKVDLSHYPNRPVNSMRPEALLIPGIHREKKILPGQLKQTVRSANKHRKQILSDYTAKRMEMLEDLKGIRENGRMQMGALKTRQYSEKSLHLQSLQESGKLLPL